MNIGFRIFTKFDRPSLEIVKNFDPYREFKEQEIFK